MAVLCRCLLLLTILLAPATRLSAATAAETRALAAATSAFRLGFYERAETAFASFAQTYSNSAHLSEVILYQAQARLQLTNYDGAIALISAHQADAGTNADRYLFWLAEALFRKGDYSTAATNFARLSTQFPDSHRRLEATLGEATARARIPDWPGVRLLLQQTNGFFQTTAASSETNELVLRGFLLLSESQLAQHDFDPAETTLQKLSPLFLPPDIAWQRQSLLCRIQIAAGRTNDALQSATALVALATNAPERGFLAESVALQAGLLQQLGRFPEAVAAYQKNLAEGVPAGLQRQALLSITELLLAQGKAAEAARLLSGFLAQFPDAPAADVALLALGELRLRQYLAGGNAGPTLEGDTNTAVVTNVLQSALGPLEELAKRFTNSPLFGIAQLDRGWCYWFQTNLPESQAAFQIAVDHLPFSTNQAIAYFKLADTQFRLGNFTNAISNYTAIVEKFGGLHQVETNLFEPALYQIVQAGLSAGNLRAATNALAKILTSYPEGFHTVRAMLLTGQEIRRHGDPSGARQMFQEFVNTAPDTPLQPLVRLAIARTYEQENNWTNAIQEYDRCLAGPTNSVAGPQAEYYRAQATWQAGDETNALALFTNFVAHNPNNALAPLAQWWKADYYFRTGVPMQAEPNYRMIFLNTNWPTSDLTYLAQMMAGLAAMDRQDLGAARGYFTNLYNTTNCATDLRIQALLAYGNTLMSLADPGDTNKTANYKEAIRVFAKICQEYPTNQLTALAWGGKANAILQWAQSSQQYDEAAKAFQQVIETASAGNSAHSQAKIGLAIVLEKLAETGAGTNRIALLNSALNQCLDVFLDQTSAGEEEKPELFWKKEAGLKAGHLAELLEEWQQALNVYKQLKVLVPALSTKFENDIARCRRHLSP